MRVVNDRRSSTRVTVRGEAYLHTPQGPLRCRCLDISSGGMSVVSPQSIKPRQRVRIESSFKGQRLVLEVLVVRRTRSREGHVLGMRFEGLGPQAREQLAEVLRNMQVQAALAMQACAFVDRLPMLQLPEPEPEPRTERSPAPPAAFTPPPVAAMPRVAKGGTQEVPVVASPPPSPRWGSTMVTPPGAAKQSGGQRPVGLEEGWTEEELVTTHYRPTSEASRPRVVRPEPPKPARHEPASLVDALELDLPEPTGPATAPTTMPRLSDELQAALDRLRRTPKAVEIERLAQQEPRTPDPARAAARGLDEPTNLEHSSDEPASRPTTSARRYRRRASVTQTYAAPRREDTQVGALYHAALANLADPDRGDGS